MKAFVLITALALCACETTINGPQVKGDTASNVRNFVSNIEPGLRPAATAACSLTLSFAVSDKDRAEVKKTLLTISTIVAAATPSQTPGQLSKAIQGVCPQTQDYRNLADGIAGTYGIAVPFIKGDPKLFIQVITDIAGGVADAAQ